MIKVSESIYDELSIDSARDFVKRVKNPSNVEDSSKGPALFRDFPLLPRY